MRRGFLFLAMALTVLWAAATPQAARAQGYQSPCFDAHPEFKGAAEANAASLDTLAWAPFGLPEQGWEAYAPLLAGEIGSSCAPFSADFAAKLATWQRAWGLAPTGVFGPEAFEVFKGLWQQRRPFILLRVADVCPEPPARYELEPILVREELAEREGRYAHRDVMAAYRRMVADARAADPEIARDPEMLKIFSAFREPTADDARCAEQKNCDGVRRAACSPHRTGAALDLYVGRLLDHTVDSTNIQNRLHQSRGPAYRWLAANARRYGFINYAFEPWHWEWVRELDPMAAQAASTAAVPAVAEAAAAPEVLPLAPAPSPPPER